MSIERLVAFVLNPVLTAAAAWLCGAIGKYGLHLDPTEVVALASTGGAAAFGGVYKWLHGRQIPALLTVEKDAKTAVAAVSAIDPKLLATIKAFTEAEAAKLATKIEPVKAPAPVAVVVPAVPPTTPPAA